MEFDKKATAIPMKKSEDIFSSSDHKLYGEVMSDESDSLDKRSKSHNMAALENNVGSINTASKATNFSRKHKTPTFPKREIDATLSS